MAGRIVSSQLPRWGAQATRPPSSASQRVEGVEPLEGHPVARRDLRQEEGFGEGAAEVVPHAPADPLLLGGAHCPGTRRPDGRAHAGGASSGAPRRARPRPTKPRRVRGPNPLKIRPAVRNAKIFQDRNARKANRDASQSGVGRRVGWAAAFPMDDRFHPRQARCDPSDAAPPGMSPSRMAKRRSGPSVPSANRPAPRRRSTGR